MADNNIEALACAALDTIKPRWRELPKSIKQALMSDVMAALTAVSAPDEVDASDEV